MQRVANDESLIKLVFSRKAFIFVLNVLYFLHSFSLFLSLLLFPSRVVRERKHIPDAKRLRIRAKLTNWSSKLVRKRKVPAPTLPRDKSEQGAIFGHSLSCRALKIRKMDDNARFKV